MELLARAKKAFHKIRLTPLLATAVILPAIAIIKIGAIFFPRQAYRAQLALGLTDITSQHYQFVDSSIDSGDTFRVHDGEQELEIQLCGINAPKEAESLNMEARSHLQTLISQGDGRIILVTAGRDRAGRIVAEAFIPTSSDDGAELHLNSEMLMAGMAYLSQTSLDTCSNGDRFPVAESMAKEQRVGVWASARSEDSAQYGASNP